MLALFHQRRMRSFPSRFALHDAVYRGTNPLKMDVHVVIAEAEYSKAETVEVGSSRFIPSRLFRLVVLGTVDFNDEPVPGTVKIDDVIAELLLPPELSGAGTEVVVPEMALLGRHFPAKFPGIGLVAAIVAERGHGWSFLV